MKVKWIKSSEQLPPENVSVLVFIPEEDNHCTTGMWDVSQKWVLLDEYRVPKSEVTYWAEMVELPEDKSYTPKRTFSNIEEDTITYQMRALQKNVFDLEKIARAADTAISAISPSYEWMAEMKAYRDLKNANHE